MNRSRHFFSALLLAALLFSWGCAGPKPAPPGPKKVMQDRSLEALPDRVYADTITVQQFRAVSDHMARSLIVQPLIQRSPRPPVITIRDVQNKTGLEIDEKIFQETIRAKLMEHAAGMVLFRDDESYRDILEERVRQSSEEVDVTLTDTRIQTLTVDRVKERDFQAGSLMGSQGQGQQTRNVEAEQIMEVQQAARVKSRVAAADYFLRGIIYQVKEIDQTNPDEGMNYFQFQFRLTDSRSGLIVWEKMTAYKMEGAYGVTAVNTQQGQGQNPQGQGALPAGWPTGAAAGQIPPGAGQVNTGTATGTAPAAGGAANPAGTIKSLTDGVMPLLEQIQKMRQ